MKLIKIAIPVIILLALLLYSLGGVSDQSEEPIPQGHVFDKAGIISKTDIRRFEWMLDLIQKESDLDIKFLFVKTIGDATVEEVAVKKMDTYGIGRKGEKQRGVLFLYVMDKNKLKIEVGYGLEAYMPDAFVGYLIRNQADAFFKASNPSMGLRLLIRILQHRIREAVLEQGYDPSILKKGVELPYLSGGAGAAEKVGINKQGQPFKRDRYDKEGKALFVAKNTVEGTFSNYISWLYNRKFDPNVGLFTKRSLPILKRFPMTRAYFDYILLQYASKEYKIIKREELAILYFTEDPLVTPMFFNKINGKWRINIRAELRNSRNHVGGVYTWSFNPDSNDKFARTFKDLLVNIRGYYRFKDGANQQLPVKVDVQNK
ncbi:TPM domain-containing protein [Fodinibius halophilus]|uniref:TPM domain-containing protein n=1 Tax=Fodinibius halophilus TaxID=1736908 RepID=A0A6M1T3A6_9BACT|nr:TPM domain-containing protein [Fodinibius halophilus]NGP87103.1 TPM domain-containing protein [Fodinibius halophilus]